MILRIESVTNRHDLEAKFFVDIPVGIVEESGGLVRPEPGWEPAGPGEAIWGAMQFNQHKADYNSALMIYLRDLGFDSWKDRITIDPLFKGFPPVHEFNDKDDNNAKI
jgi:hypothetical protein